MQPTESRKRWRTWLFRLGAASLFVWPTVLLFQLYGAGNLHEIIPGQLYRGAQPSPAALARLIDRHHIRTVLNVRGCCWPDEWYLGEAKLCQERGVNLEDVSFSAVHLPSRHELRILIDVLDRAERPIFVHCRHGADRTGIAGMAAHLLMDEHTFASAHQQLSIRYGHLAIGKTAMLDRFMKLYDDWLTASGQTHSPANFRHWALHEYQGGWCNAHFEKIERIFSVPHAEKALEYNVVVRNIGPTDWRFQPLKTAGHHVVFKLLDEAQNIVYEGRAGLLDQVIKPGETIQVRLIIPPLKARYYRLMVDMIEEGHCWFHQSGSEPWEEELDLRE
jgi:undecaprenyl-diphosphatase